MSSIEDVVTRVADHTIERDMESEEWEKGIAILGLLSTGEDRYIEAARRLVDRSIETQTDAGQFSYGSLDPKPHQEWTGLEDFKGLVDPAVIGNGVLYFYERTGDEYYLDAARQQYEFLMDAPRTEDGGIPQHKGEVELWVDTIYELCPFLARYGANADRAAAADEAAHQIEVQAKHLQDPHTGLFRHQWRETPNTYPQGSFWSRGNGWALAGILDTIQHLPDDHESIPGLVEILRTLAEAVLPLQSRSGLAQRARRPGNPARDLRLDNVRVRLREGDGNGLFRGRGLSRGGRGCHGRMQGRRRRPWRGQTGRGAAGRTRRALRRHVIRSGVVP